MGGGCCSLNESVIGIEHGFAIRYLAWPHCKGARRHWPAPGAGLKPRIFRAGIGNFPQIKQCSTKCFISKLYV